MAYFVEKNKIEHLEIGLACVYFVNKKDEYLGIGSTWDYFVKRKLNIYGLARLGSIL